jgi:hypothetical protein
MSYTNFLDLTPRQLTNAIEGFFNRREEDLKEQWEQTRMIYAIIANQPVYGYKNKPKPPKQLMPFPWDEGSGLPDQEQLDKLKKDMDEYNKSINGNNDIS